MILGTLPATPRLRLVGLLLLTALRGLGQAGDQVVPTLVPEPVEAAPKSRTATASDDDPFRVGWYRNRMVAYKEVDGVAITEGDIVLDRDSLQPVPFTDGDKPGSGLRSRAVVRPGDRYRWPDARIPYFIEEMGSQNPSLALVVRLAIAHWEEKTSYRFVAVDKASQANHLVFRGDKSGCWSMVGMTGGAQDLSLSPGCQKGQAIHEIGHAIGLWHEQSRSDRDDFVKVSTENAAQESRHNFDIMDCVLGSASCDGKDVGYYDYASIMHYESYAFSTNGKNTIDTVPMKGIPVGQRQGLSPGDVDAAERLRSGTLRPFVIATNPSGLDILVDGQVCTSPCLRSDWTEGTKHTVEAPETGSLGSVTHYFARWNDSGSRAHEFTANKDYTVLSANYTTQRSTEQPDQLPDLTVSKFSAPTNGDAGQKVTVDLTVGNVGKDPARPFRIGIYLSTNSTITTVDRLIATCRATTDLPSGNAVRCSGQVSIPADVPAGSYFLGAWADDVDDVAEANEINNGLANTDGATGITSTVSARPNLTITSFRAPTAAPAGGRLQGMRVEVRNQGSQATGKFRVGFYLLPEGGDLATLAFTGWSCLEENGLPTGETFGCNGDVGIPSGLAAGNYYLIAISDDLAQIDESDESDNFRLNDQGLVRLTTDTVSLPDLETVTFSAPVEGRAGDLLSGVRATVVNRGVAAASAFRVGYYFSPVGGAASSWLGTGSSCAADSGLAAGGTFYCSGDIRVPSSLPPGQYTVWAFADDLGRVAETDNSNNTRQSGAGPFRILDPTQAGRPDLTVTSVSGGGTVAVGAGQAMSVAVRNQGTGAATAFRIGFYLSTDAVITTADVLLATCSLGSLAAGATQTCSGTVTIPAQVSAGTYYLGVVADDQGQVDEPDERNNSLVASSALNITAVAVKPDLVLTSLSGPASALVNSAPTLNTVVRNQATGQAGAFRVAFYLSTDRTITTADTYLAHCAVPGLSGGTNYTCGGAVRLPAGAGPGVYYIGAIADDLAQLDEVDEGNNSLAAASAIQLMPIEQLKADLVITSVSGPVTAVIGSSQALSTGVRNQGTVAAGAFRVSFYLSSDAAISNSDTYLGHCSSGGLAAGALYTCAGNMTLPAWLAPGGYYLGAVADDLNQIDEADERNNGAAANDPIRLTAAFVAKPDLQLVSVTGPSTVVAGSAQTMTAVVKNQGTAAAGGFRFAFYLSADATITSSDIYLAHCNVSSLATGGATTCSGSVTVPSWINVGRYYLGSVADDLQQVDESDETNNSLAAPSRLDVTAATAAKPDITVTGVSGPATALVASSPTLSSTIRNQGTVAAGAFRVAFYLSPDSSVTSSDTYLAHCNVGSLAAGENFTCSGAVAVPSWINAGSYYIGTVADDLGQVEESDERNNSMAANSPIILTAPRCASAFCAGDVVSVNTGGGSLRLRTCGSTACSTVVLMPDGTQMTVRGGPTQADGYTWWYLQGNVAGVYRDGWAVGDYLHR